ncbi:MAG: hypothetical protein JSR36_11605 [Proteobacteria bacterium]|nr:hypothetical protein [Pseudomonadota bacterium]
MRTRAGLKSNPVPPVHSVKDLLKERGHILEQVSRQVGRQQFWEAWLRERLEAGLYGRISGIAEQAGRLTVYAESAAWSARLRFAMAELDAEMRAASATLSAVSVRVLPRT